MAVAKPQITAQMGLAESPELSPRAMRADYMQRRQQNSRSLGPVASQNLYIGKRSTVVNSKHNSDIEGILAVKKKAKRVTRAILKSNRNAAQR